MKNYYIDLGSSTIKVYCYKNELELLEEHSIYFKNDFDAEKGISKNNLEELISYNGFKQVVINTDLLSNVDIYGINYIINFNKILRSKNTNLVLCDKTNIWRTLFGNQIQHINNELEVFNG